MGQDHKDKAPARAEAWAPAERAKGKVKAKAPVGDKAVVRGKEKAKVAVKVDNKAKAARTISNILLEEEPNHARWR